MAWTTSTAYGWPAERDKRPRQLAVLRALAGSAEGVEAAEIARQAGSSLDQSRPPGTPSDRETPFSVRLGSEDGLPEESHGDAVECSANRHNVQTVTQARIGALIAVLFESRTAQVDSALLFALGMDSYRR